MKRQVSLLCAAFMLVLTGCAALGIVQPKSLGERLTFAYETNAGLRNAATAQLEAGVLSSADGEYVLKITDANRNLLDTAKVALGAGDISTAEGRLALTLQSLTQLQGYLNSKASKP